MTSKNFSHFKQSTILILEKSPDTQMGIQVGIQLVKLLRWVSSLQIRKWLSIHLLIAAYYVITELLYIPQGKTESRLGDTQKTVT